MTPATTQQPAPHPGGIACWENLLASGLVPAIIRADCEARDALGRERYGTPLETGNGRSAATDLYQELLDACVYAHQLALEQPHDTGREWEDVRDDLLAMAELVRARI